MVSVMDSFVPRQRYGVNLSALRNPVNRLGLLFFVRVIRRDFHPSCCGFQRATGRKLAWDGKTKSIRENTRLCGTRLQPS